MAHEFKRFQLHVLMDDGTTYAVPLAHAARDAWDAVSAKHGYGDSRPSMRTAFWAWHTLHKRGDVTDKFEQFHAHVDDVDLERLEPVGPTQPPPPAD